MLIYKYIPLERIGDVRVRLVRLDAKVCRRTVRLSHVGDVGPAFRRRPRVRYAAHDERSLTTHVVAIESATRRPGRRFVDCQCRRSLLADGLHVTVHPLAVTFLVARSLLHLVVDKSGCVHSSWERRSPFLGQRCLDEHDRATRIFEEVPENGRIYESENDDGAGDSAGGAE